VPRRAISRLRVDSGFSAAKNISRKEHPHRDLSTALPRISCGDPWL
jgi:hypothetical protein